MSLNAKLPVLELSAAQVRCLASQVRHEMLFHFRMMGPCSVADVARPMGREPEGLYHHLKLLLDVDLVREAGSRRLPKREETLYDSTCDLMKIKPGPWKGEYAAAVIKLYKNMFKVALKRMVNYVDSGADPNEELAIMHRLDFVAGKQKADQLREKLKDLHEWLEQPDPSPDAKRLGILVAAYPTTHLVTLDDSE